jgi:hypothetical protein
VAGPARAERLGSVSCFPAWPPSVLAWSRYPGGRTFRGPRASFPGPAAVRPGASAADGGLARPARRRREPGDLRIAGWKAGAVGRRTGEPAAAREEAAWAAG